MRKISLIFIILPYSLILYAQVDMPLDTLYYQFERVKKICDKDNGKLWGKSLYGPILVIDKTSKLIVFNQLDMEGQLSLKGAVYVGKYPEEKIVASTSTKFAGKSWVVISYPFNKKDTFQLYLTYIHESFHRIQGELGFNCEGYCNNHMDKMDGRIYLQLEWHALLEAIIAIGEDRNRAIRDALLFRQYRRQLFSGADTMESRFELHEGLADYTAYKLCCPSQSEIKDKIIERKLKYLDNEGSCVRSFGYYSGLLYAYLLDETGNLWQTKLKCGDDLGLLLQHLLKIDISNDTVNWFNQSKVRYPYMKIYKQEVGINNKKEKVLYDYRIRFTKNPVIIIDLLSAELGLYMSPHPLDTLGTV